MFEQIILGTVQGIAEWLPVSSEGMIILTERVVFNRVDIFETAVEQALFLHLGTFLAAFCYFFPKIKEYIKACFRFPQSDTESQQVIVFLLLSTLISGGLGILLIKAVSSWASQVDPAGRAITALIGLLLIGTGILQLKTRDTGHRSLKDLTVKDGIILGIVQGLAVLPGFSRSGLTVSALLLRNFNKTHALELSFLMSLPIVLAGNIFLNVGQTTPWEPERLIGLVFSFLFGILTIHGLLKLAQKVNFGLFVIFFGLLTIASVFV